MHSLLTKTPDHAIIGLNFTMNSLFPFITSLHYDNMWLMSSQDDFLEVEESSNKCQHYLSEFLKVFFLTSKDTKEVKI